MIELWCPIIGYVGRYEVSSLGRVRSIKRRRTAGGILKPHPDSSGYPSVSLRIDGKRRVIRVHRLVAQAFLPPPAPFQKQVAHLDGSRTNNAAHNLKWACNAENSDHKRFHGTHQAGEQHPRARLTAQAVADILASSAGNCALGRKYGVNESAIRKIRARQRWKAAECEASQSGPQGNAQPSPGSRPPCPKK